VTSLPKPGTFGKFTHQLLICAAIPDGEQRNMKLHSVVSAIAACIIPFANAASIAPRVNNAFQINIYGDTNCQNYLTSWNGEANPFTSEHYDYDYEPYASIMIVSAQDGFDTININGEAVCAGLCDNNVPYCIIGTCFPANQGLHNIDLYVGICTDSPLGGLIG
jgi:hypothetical protein